MVWIAAADHDPASVQQGVDAFGGETVDAVLASRPRDVDVDEDAFGLHGAEPLVDVADRATLDRGDLRLFEFPRIDAAAVREVLIMTNTQRCFAVADPLTFK